MPARESAFSRRAASSLAARAARLRASDSRSLAAPSHGQGAAETQATLPASAAPSGSRAAPQCGHALGSGSSKESPAARACSRVMSPARSIGRPFLIF